jgi:hypothetical protein
LKQIAGFDSSHSSVDMLWKICTKFGFVSRKFNKTKCVETIVKAVKDRICFIMH